MRIPRRRWWFSLESLSQDGTYIGGRHASIHGGGRRGHHAGLEGELLLLRGLLGRGLVLRVVVLGVHLQIKLVN